MIEINLKTGQQGFDINNVGGLDLSKINVKYVMLALVMLYIPELGLTSFLEGERNTEQEKINQLNNENQKIQAELNKLKDFETRIKTLKEQETILMSKLEVVKQIISTKKNPWNVLLYITKNMPKEVWLTNLNFSSEPSPGVITLKGFAIEYGDQGKFQNNLESSVFFDKRIEYKKVTLENLSPELKAFTPFEMQATVKRLE